MIRAVLWDFGGVITTSPFEAFNRFERQQSLPDDFIRGINARNPHSNAWAHFERGDIGPAEFDRRFLEESGAAGHPIPGATVLGLLAGDVRPSMVEAVRRCRGQLRTACLTNNFRRPTAAADASGAERRGDTSPAPSTEPGAEPITAPVTGPASEREDGMGVFDRLRGLFDVVVESSVIGVRKPEVEFYRHALEAVGATPEECVFLDDLGINLKPARALGMHTIKVVDPDRALRELERLTGLELLG